MHRREGVLHLRRLICKFATMSWNVGRIPKGIIEGYGVSSRQIFCDNPRRRQRSGVDQHMAVEGQGRIGDEEELWMNGVHDRRGMEVEDGKENVLSTGTYDLDGDISFFEARESCKGPGTLAITVSNVFDMAIPNGGGKRESIRGIGVHELPVDGETLAQGQVVDDVHILRWLCVEVKISRRTRPLRDQVRLDDLQN